ncbi:hypothetical protein C8R45DRAFT_461445 [Mycena sanguinolenta]|nr:hypothetical protein C8R45DRAFT_461445 [Mycena sanguinolenta]
MTQMNLDEFLNFFDSPEHALSNYAQGDSFDRSLPRRNLLDANGEHPAVLFIKGLLETGARRFNIADLPEGAKEAYRQGWVVYLDVLEDSFSSSHVFVDFPTLLHRSRVSMLLTGSTSLPTTVEAMDLWQFCCAIVQAMSSTALRGSRDLELSRTGSSVPEAHYQNEVYRAASKTTKGRGLWLSPEFGTDSSSARPGRIDFFITSKGWGIEVLREGDQTDAHLQRFEPGGAYNAWLQKGTIQEYVLLDFRHQTTARKQWPPGTRLFHVAFDSDFEGFEIKDSMLDVKRSGRLAP